MILAQNRDVQVNTACGSTATYTMNKDNIPVELSERNRWVKRTSYKHGGKGWNTPKNWHSLDDIDGDTMLVTTETDLLVIDADHVVNDKGEWIPEAKEDYERIREAGGPTYEESSVSGHGRHLVYDNAEYPDEPLSPIRIKYPEYKNWAGDGFTPQIEIWYAAKHCFRITGKITASSSDRVMSGEGAANALRVAKQIVEERRSDDDSGTTGMTDAEIERLKRSTEPIPDGSGHSYEVARIAELITSAGDVLSDEQIADTVYREMQTRFEGELKETFYDNAVKDAARFRAKVKKGRKDKAFCAYSVKAWEAENPGKTFSDAGKPWKAAFIAGLKAQEEGKTFDDNSRIDAGWKKRVSERQYPTVISDEDGAEIVQPTEISLELTKNGEVKNTFSNVRDILEQDQYLKGKLSYNMQNGLVYLSGFHWNKLPHVVRDSDVTEIRSFIADEYGIAPSKDRTEELIQMIAERNKFHPVRDLLEGLKSRGHPTTENIAELLPRYLGAERSEFTTQITKLLLYGIIQRQFSPGVKFDYCCIFVDELQGTGKSTMSRMLAIKDDWFSDSLTSLEDPQKAFEVINGCVVVELGEMLSIRRAKDVEGIKSFISRTVDKIRRPYLRHSEEFPRGCVFIGTSNKFESLPQDPSGNRRFVPIFCDGKKADKHPLDNEEETRAFVLQCFADAMNLGELEGWPLVLDHKYDSTLDQLREQGTPDDPRVGMIQQYLDDHKMIDYVCSRLIWDEVFCDLDHPKEPQSYELRDISDIMSLKIEGWKRYEYEPGSLRSGQRKHKFTDEFRKYGSQRSWKRIPPGEPGYRSTIEDDDIPL